VKSLKIPSAVHGGGSGAGRAGGGVSLGAAVAWPCRGVCWAGSGGEPGELAGRRGSGGPVGAPEAWAWRGCAGSGERGELATRAGGGSMVPPAGREMERQESRSRAEAEEMPAHGVKGGAFC